jgi:hypothetical protein
LTPDQVVDPFAAIGWANILEPWVLLHREIIVNARAGMYWVEGPAIWTTNEQLPGVDEGQQVIGGFYRNPLNLDRCVHNLVRSAVAVRRVADMHQPEGGAVDTPQLEALDRLLEAFDADLDPLAWFTLRGGEWPRFGEAP